MRPVGPATILVLLCSLAAPVNAQQPASADGDTTADVLRGLELRTIGPAVMGGGIADVAIDPRRRGTWYLAVGSGGVWKTENAAPLGGRSSTTSRRTPRVRDA